MNKPIGRKLLFATSGILLYLSAVAPTLTYADSFDDVAEQLSVKAKTISKALWRRPGRIPIEAIVYYNGQSCDAMLEATLVEFPHEESSGTRIYVDLTKLECGKKQVPAHGYAVGWL